MKTVFAKALCLGLAVATASAVGCSGGVSSTDDTGTVALKVSGTKAHGYGVVNYTLAGPDGFSATGSFKNSDGGDEIEGVISGLPGKLGEGRINKGYTLDLSATSRDGKRTCSLDKANLSFECADKDENDNRKFKLSCTGSGGKDDDGQDKVEAEVTFKCNRSDAGTDSGQDSEVDSGAADTGVADTGAVDTGVIDTGVIDTGVVDTGVVDTGVIDTGVIDTGVIDTGVVDTGVVDTGVVDTGVIDTGVVDTGVVDTGVVDTGVVDTGVVDTGVVDTGVADTGAIDSGIDSGVAVDSGAGGDAGPGPTACQTNNGGANCTPTEMKFVQKDPTLGCYQCLVNGECLDNTVLGDTNKECGDVTGNATGGAQSGTAYNTLCLGLIDCILGSACASSDVSICYCGSLGAGNACSGGSSGANGKCIQQEVDGANHLVTDAPSAVFPSLGDLTNASGKANQIFVCAKSNSCDTMCSN